MRGLRIRGWVATFRSMFAFFSTRLGCLGSLAVSAALTFLLYLLMRHS